MERPVWVRRQRVCMQGSGLDFPIPTSVFEQVLYTPQVPYCIEYQKYESDAVTRPHYGHTLEVILNFGVEGDYQIGGRQLPLKKDSVLLIPPNVLHSGTLRGQKNAYLINLKFDFEKLRAFVDMEKLLAQYGCSLHALLFSRPDYQQTVAAVHALIAADHDPLERVAALSRLFGVFVRGLENVRMESCPADDALTRLITWTEERYRRKITVEDAAAVMHFSRSYFCRYFRQKTGMTYLNYLNRLRIEQAELMLLSGMSASACCLECGFEDLPYFIQLFRKQTGYTTREYVKRFAALQGTNAGERAEG